MVQNHSVNNSPVDPKAIRGQLTYEDKVIEKIVGLAVEHVNGLLAINGGFFSNIKEKLVNTNNVTDGVNVEVGTKQVAVDLDAVVEYQQHVPTIFDQIKRVVEEEITKMTDLEVVEVNVNVVDIKTRAQFEADSVSLQDRVSNGAQATSQFVSNQYDNAKGAVSNGVDRVQEQTEPRVK
ncbi:Asp23/Gls24 family envelope stress response protein [Streptococcus halotolerans]|uniref:Asp23/Gls24 family envelope stress response protein n=1 Tax=Streptococcus halotolerans TaxID=1814128 RepID=UPI0007893B51|nr:Asp23/Gls24 family envelope stress response protein [Streptococcus halotolerans]